MATLARDNKSPKDRAYSLNEAVADIAYIAGEHGYYGGDSRGDIADFIRWANEFEDIFTQEQDDDGEYIERIHSFAYTKLKLNDSSLS